MYSGVYDIANISGTIYGVFNNGTPVDAYRGAGRPEATTLIERLVDLLAARLGMDPVELRRKNLIPKFENGHDVATGITYDSGDYEATLDTCLNAAGYPSLRAEQERARQEGRLVGIGVSTYVESLWPWAFGGGGRGWIPGRTLGERHRTFPSHGKSERDGGILAAWPGGRDGRSPRS